MSSSKDNKLEAIYFGENCQFLSSPISSSYFNVNFYGPHASEDHKTIIQNNRLVSVLSNAAVSFSVPDTIKTIAKNCFHSSRFTEILLPETLEFIEYSAFDYSSKLTDLVIPSNTVILENPFAFAGDSGSGVLTINCDISHNTDDYTTASNYTAKGFWHTGFNKIVFQGAVKKLYKNVLYDATTKELVFGEGVMATDDLDDSN